MRGVIGAAVAAGRYICELDPAKAALRDAEMRERPKAETATDLVPAISTGIIVAGTQGAGIRFIQPRLADGRLLDEATGDGWRLFVRGAAKAPADVRVMDVSGLGDQGAVAAWLGAHGAEAVLVRPDHYVFGTGAPEALLAARAATLGVSREVGA